MTNPETRPGELVLDRGTPIAPAAAGTARRRPAVEVVTARDVPLGGPRAMTVRRTLPHRHRSMVGAWCFADHYGPDDVSATGGMDVPPHPHTGLQTVSWLFSGEIEHRDSGGVHALVHPGELNLMTGGHGVCHSETSTPRTTTLHGFQLWLALPEESRGVPRAFQHHVPTPVSRPGTTARVFLGSLLGETSPVRTHTPVLGAELLLDAGAAIALDVGADFEHGILVDLGEVSLGGTVLQRSDLGFVAPGPTTLELANTGDGRARVLLLGGPPFPEEIVMWWNFVGRSHEEIEQFRAEWESHAERFGAVVGYPGPVERLPAPALPTARLRPRSRPR
jgi:redox-sensitive bicupin YhaK (pirin superfamily)